MVTEIAGPPDEENDPIRTFNADEKRLLTQNLLAVTEKAHSGDFSATPLTPRLLCLLHREIFGGVRDHAGKMRSRGWGQEHLTFGPNRSSHRNDVDKDVTRLCERAEWGTRDISNHPTAPDYEEQALRLSLKCHAELIKIHPFEDGNGRTSRLLLAVMLVRLGLRPIPIEAPKREYTDALNQYFKNPADIDALVDLYLRLA